jgi:WD40 repeat protein
MIVSTWGEIAYCFDTATDSLYWKIDYADPVEYNAFHCIDISPDGKTIALGSADHRVYLANVSDGKIIHRIESWAGHTKILKSVQFSPDGKWLATAGEDQTIFIWDLSDYSKKYTLTGHVNTVYGMDWSADNHFVLSVSMDGSLKEWDIRNPFENKYEICDFGPWQTPLTTDKKLFAAPCSDKKLVIYEPSTGKAISNIGTSSGLCADISKDSKLLVTSSFDGIVRAWDIPTNKELKTFTGHTARVDGIVYKDDTRQILSVGDSTLRIWDLNTDKEIMILPLGSDPFRIILSPDEKVAFIGFNDGTIKTIDTQNWHEINSFKCEKGLQEMAVSPDGKNLAIFSGKNIEIWDARKFKRIYLLSGHEKSGYGIGFSDKGDYLISGSGDQTFKLWNLATGVCTLTFHNFEDTIYSSKFLSEKEVLLTSSQGMVFYYRFD